MDFSYRGRLARAMKVCYAAAIMPLPGDVLEILLRSRAGIVTLPHIILT
jgi:hypothetical protein